MSVRRPRAVTSLIAAALAALSAAAAPPAAAAAVPRVSDVRAHAVSSSRIDLRWRTPDYPGFAGTLIRMLPGDTAPGSPTEGRQVALLSRRRTAFTVTGLQPGARYSFGLFASYPAGQWSDVTRARATTGPAPVAKLRAFVLGPNIDLRWVNPTTPSFAGVEVRLAQGSTPPATRSDGTAAGRTSGDARSLRLPDLAADTRYAVSVWARDTAGRWSTPVHTGFTTLGGAASGATLAGTVTDGAGHPLAGVAIRPTGYRDGSSYPAARTGADGSYVLHVPAEEFLVVVDASHASGGNSDATGYVEDVTRVNLTTGATAHRDFVLRAGGAVRGRITDSTGAPLAGVRPYLAPVAPYLSPTSSGILISFGFGQFDGARTDANGRYTVTGVPAGPFLVCGDPSVGPVTGGAGDSSGYAVGCSRATLITRQRATVGAPDVALAKTDGGAIHGTVYDATGRPLASAAVDVAPDGSRDTIAFTVTGPDGGFELSGLPPGNYEVCAQATGESGDRAPAGSARTCVPGVTVTQGQTALALVHLQPGGALSGTVTDPDGRPVAGVDVTVGRGRGGFGTTDGAGHYRIAGIPAASYPVCFGTDQAVDHGRPTGVVPGCYQDARPVRVVAGATRTGIDATLAYGGAIAGTVTDSAGRPVPNGEVTAASRTGFGFGEVRPDGTYIVRGLAPGSYHVCTDTFTPGGGDAYVCRTSAVTVTVGTVHRGIDATFPAGGSVTVTVADHDGHPIAGADAVLVRACARGDSCLRLPMFSRDNVVVAASWVTDANGQVRFDDVVPGEYAVCALGYHAATSVDPSPTGYADSCGGPGYPVTVTAGATASAHHVLEPGGVVTATVTDASGNPVHDAFVHVTGSPADDLPEEEFPSFGGPGQPSEENISAADGTVAIRGVRPGAAAVCVDTDHAAGGSSAGGYLKRCLPAQVRVRAGHVTALGSVPLAAGAAISGQVRDSAGHAVRAADAVVFTAHGRFVDAAEADTDGTYRFGRLVPGTYVVCFAPYGSYQAQCYDGVPWPRPFGPPPLAAATKITVTAGELVDNVDAALVPR